jgi:hypothetical protein
MEGRVFGISPPFFNPADEKDGFREFRGGNFIAKFQIMNEGATFAHYTMRRR